MDVEHDLAAGGAVEVEQEVLPGDLADGDRPPDLERLVTAQPAELHRTAPDGEVEVAAVGGVEGAAELDQAVGVGLVHVETAPAGGGDPAGLGRGRVEAAHGLVDEAAELGPADRGDVVELAVDEGGGRGAERAGEVGDPLGAPGREPAGGDGGVDVGEPPGALDDAADEGAPAVGGAAERGDELHQVVVADQGSAVAGDGHAGVDDALGEGGRALGRGEDVALGPGDDRVPLGDDERLAAADAAADGVEEVGGGVLGEQGGDGGGGGHGTTSGGGGEGTRGEEGWAVERGAGRGGWGGKVDVSGDSAGLGRRL
ncbi:hypothetical protein F9L07_07660 [Pimelobacter simplex]|uniref:Uncharacterized protein n=1 Tax=Nocardioides simplex TaxID=2045 RepID=A0A7J5E194_NOCSI|nr:hypothetical protein [Pimelobacter simplex]KAB2811724.1 hypothetical protein F9L07_07660 [Pimelobacter simplex]